MASQALSLAPWWPRLCKNDATLTSLLLLPFRKLSEDDFVALFDAIGESNTHLKEFLASGIALTDRAIEAFAKMTVKRYAAGYPLDHVCIGDASFGANGLRALLAAWKECAKNVHLADTPLIGRLDMANKGIDAAGAVVLAEIMALFDSKLAGTLVMSRNPIECRGVLVLQTAFSSLTSLDVSDCDINDAGMEHLAASIQQSTCLQELVSCGNPALHDGLHAVGQAIQSSRCLKIVRIASVDGADGTLFWQGFASANSQHSALRSLFVTGLTVSSECVDGVRMAMMLPELTTLELSEAGLNADILSCILNREPFTSSIEILNLRNNLIDGEGLRCTGRLVGACLPALKELVLHANVISNISAEHFKFAVVRLDLSCNRLDEADLVTLGDVLTNTDCMLGLKQLVLAENVKDAETQLAHLASLCKDVKILS
jgi:hypothetical protein